MVKLLIESDNKSTTYRNDVLTGSADSRPDDRVLRVTGNGPRDDLVQL